MQATLDTAEARCVPGAKPCAMRNRCARFNAPAGAGRPVGDWTAIDLINTAGTALCAGYIDAAALRKADHPAPKNVKPWPSAVSAPQREER